MRKQSKAIRFIGGVLAAAVFGSMLAVPVLAASILGFPRQETPKQGEVKDGPFNLTPAVFNDDSGLFPEKANPVNLSHTRVIWNGRDITDDPALRYTPTLEEFLNDHNIRRDYGGLFNYPYAKGTTKDWPPSDGFSIAASNPETVGNDSKFSVDTDLFFLWTNFEFYTFACNEKTVKQISFSGLPDDALVALRPDGLELHFKEPGEYKVLYEVMDSDGVTRAYPTTYTFKIYPADIYLNPPKEDE